MKNYCRDLGKNTCRANYQCSGKVCVCVWRGHLPAICHFLLASEVGVGPSCSRISASPPQLRVGSRTPRPAPPVAGFARAASRPRAAGHRPGSLGSRASGSGRAPWSPVSSLFRVQDFSGGPGPPAVFSILFCVPNSFLARQGTCLRLEVFTLDGADEGK